MPDLSKFQAKICYTSSGVLIHNQQTLLVHHKKLDIWLPPGGHIDDNELPHIAAEREFLEETGVKVKVLSFGPTINAKESQYLPNPFAVNLHWINKSNYQARINSGSSKRITSDKWPNGCEQHISFVYLVSLLEDNIELTPQDKEINDIGWFSAQELESLQTTLDIKNELTHAFTISSSNRLAIL